MIILPGILSQGGVKLPSIGTALNDCTWEQIKAISDAGLARDYFGVGDRKAVKLNGKAGNLSLNGTYYCFIIGIDHNSDIEGVNCIHFQFGVSALSGGVHTAFCDSGYQVNKTSGNWFNINNALSSAGGWAESHMRTTLIPTFKNCLPAELQSVLKKIIKYTDNQGYIYPNPTGLETYVTQTQDEIFLLSEYEIFGAITKANPTEQNFQKRYDYYAAGNSAIKYQHNSISTAVYYWLRSPYASVSNANGFTCVAKDGQAYSGGTFYSYGFAPAFCV